ncbi:MAG: polyphosphate kinase 2 family protein [Pedobacter sp.]|nr:MAG: polyphosphate kinase 2 family protein [Pedobacter sp.]
MNDDILQYKLSSGKKLKLKKYSTTYKGTLEKEAGIDMLEDIKKELNKSQEILYASGTNSVLVLFQAMDAAGKDSAIEHVMSGLNPQGCQVFSFKSPSSEEYAHDFLWRHYRALPEKGRIGIHNRSHYENVLVCKVHPEFILKENIPGYNHLLTIDKGFWKKRYESIRSFEKHLSQSGTTIIKIFLHLSKDEQKQRFLDRIDDKDKNWKFAGGDIGERKLWDSYQRAYEEAFENTATEDCPWYIVPADKKWYARLVISQIINSRLNELNLKFPVLSEEESSSLSSYRAGLLAEK